MCKNAFEIVSIIIRPEKLGMIEITGNLWVNGIMCPDEYNFSASIKDEWGLSPFEFCAKDELDRIADINDLISCNVQYEYMFENEELDEFNDNIDGDYDITFPEEKIAIGIQVDKNNMTAVIDGNDWPDLENLGEVDLDSSDIEDPWDACLEHISNQYNIKTDFLEKILELDYIMFLE